MNVKRTNQRHLVDLLGHEVGLHNNYKFSSYYIENIQRLYYKDQQIFAVQFTQRIIQNT
jgi:hypothetical protein